MTAGSEGVVDATLWCLHVAGPDEVYPAPDRATAQLWATQWTVWHHQRQPVPHPYDPVMTWSVAPWPHSEDAHANELALSIVNNTWPVDPLAALADQRDERGGVGEVTQADRDLVDEVDELLRVGDCSGAECAVGTARIAATPTDTRGGESALREALERIAAGTTIHLESGETWPSPLAARASQDIARAALLASPAAPGGVLPDREEKAWNALSLWFFRDLSDEQRSKLFALWLGQEAAREADTHGIQQRLLRRLAALLAARPPLLGDRADG